MSYTGEGQFGNVIAELESVLVSFKQARAADPHGHLATKPDVYFEALFEVCKELVETVRDQHQMLDTLASQLKDVADRARQASADAIGGHRVG